MDQILEAFAKDPEYLIGLVCGSLGISVVGFIAFLIARTCVRNTREREQSRREIAAYVAEGTLSAPDAEHLLQPRPWWSRNAGGVGAFIRDFSPRHAQPRV